MGDLTANFSRSEFACPCGCGADDISIELVDKLQRVRDGYGRPIVITCGARCWGLNATVSKYPIHPTGTAADIEMPKDGEARHHLLCLLMGEFDRVGIYDRHIHVDIDDRYKQPWLWLGKSR